MQCLKSELESFLKNSYPRPRGKMEKFLFLTSKLDNWNCNDFAKIKSVLVKLESMLTAFPATHIF